MNDRTGVYFGSKKCEKVMIDYGDLKEGMIIGVPRFSLPESLSYKPGTMLSFCEVCETIKRGAVQFYARGWHTICIDCIQQIHAALPDNNEQE